MIDDKQIAAFKLTLIFLGMAIVVWIILSLKKTAAVAVEGTKTFVTKTINPASDQNIFYRGANALTGGNSDASLGTRIFEFFNPGK